MANPNVCYFVTHGGLLSTQGKIHWSVRIVGIPMLADQNLIIVKAVSRGYGILLHFANITTESLEWALKEVLQYSRYCVKQLSIIPYTDFSMHPTIVLTDYI
jgi:UDP:flavonoid glycosyltransferase YjiC (YdhE family)